MKPDTDGVETGEPRGPVHSCKNCAHLAKDSCDDPCAGCTVRWRSGVSDRWEPALGVSVARREPSTPSPTDGSAKDNQALRTLSRLSDEMGEEL